jgi:hypothetical protein
MRSLSNIFWLGAKELRSFFSDFVLLGFVIWSFTFSVYSQAQSNSQELHNAAVGVVDENHSALSRRMIAALLPPYFKRPQPIAASEVDRGLDIARYTFVIVIPPNFERDVLAGRYPAVQVDIDATAMVQAGLQLRSADPFDRNQQFCFTHRGRFSFSRARDRGVAGDARRARGLQSKCDDRMVHEHHGHHQQRHHAGDHSGRRRRHSRARTWHHGPSSRHARDAIRDRHVEGLG